MKNYKLIAKIKGFKTLICNDPKKALAQLKKIPGIKNVKEADDEDQYEIAIILGDAYFYNYRFKEAIKYFEQALKNSSCKDRFICYYRLGDCYFEIDKYRKSVDCYKKALSDKDDISEDILGQIYHGLVMDYMSMNNFSSAISEANKIIQLYKNSKIELEKELYQSAFSAISTCYWKLGDSEKSEDYFRKTIALPNIAQWILEQTYANKGHRLFKNKQWNEAVTYYKKAIDITDSIKNKRYFKTFIKFCNKELRKTM